MWRRAGGTETVQEGVVVAAVLTAGNDPLGSQGLVVFRPETANCSRNVQSSVVPVRVTVTIIPDSGVGASAHHSSIRERLEVE